MEELQLLWEMWDIVELALEIFRAVDILEAMFPAGYVDIGAHMICAELS